MIYAISLIKQGNHYVSLILRKMRINVDFSDLCDEFWQKMELMAIFHLMMFPCRQVARVGGGASVKDYICVCILMSALLLLMIMLYLQKVLIKIVHLYIIQIHITSY
jgi:hypothetical protein